MRLSSLLYSDPIEIPGNRQHQGLREVMIRIIAIIYASFHIYTAGFGAFPNMIQRSIHVTFAIILIYLLYSFGRKNGSSNVAIADYFSILIAVISGVWIYINYENYSSVFFDLSQFDLILGFLFIVVVLEGSRRVMGLAIPILSILAILYALFGYYMPGGFKHQGTTVTVLINNLYTSTSGLWGMITSISATTIAIFIIFGAVMLHTGAASTFSNIALWVSGRAMGGPAKVATISSGLFGMITGSAAANVAVTGSVTIPMMKRNGYKSEFAAAVEAVASSGGQLLPPIMGSAAFIMAELISVPYLSIAISAVIPALLFYLAFYYCVHFYSKKQNYKGLQKSEIPKSKIVFEPIGLLQTVLPILLLIYLLSEGYSTARSGFWAVVLLMAIFLLRELITNRKNFRTALFKILRALEDAGYGLILIAVLAASAQIIINVLATTGLALVFSQMIVGLANNSLIISLLVAMILCIILGMGMPTVAAYLIAAAVIGPSFTGLGLEPVAVHLFIFYFAVLSGITPPVCAAIFVSAGMAKANWVKSALLAFRIGIVAFIIPFVFIYSPELLLLNVENLWSIVFSVITAIVGSTLLASGVIGYFLRKNYLWESILLVFTGFIMIIPGIYTDFIGIVIAIFLYAMQKWINPMQNETEGNTLNLQQSK